MALDQLSGHSLHQGLPARFPYRDMSTPITFTTTGSSGQAVANNVAGNFIMTGNQGVSVTANSVVIHVHNSEPPYSLQELESNQDVEAQSVFIHEDEEYAVSIAAATDGTEYTVSIAAATDGTERENEVDEMQDEVNNDVLVNGSEQLLRRRRLWRWIKRVIGFGRG
ncbi:hypothetical protein HWV62_22477 [Athelia sp. TMB]|nr:hypothetical protein HWV62_22477 [Athelia sp. TMB]